MYRDRALYNSKNERLAIFKQLRNTKNPLLLILKGGNGLIVVVVQDTFKRSYFLHFIVYRMQLCIHFLIWFVVVRVQGWVYFLFLNLFIYLLFCSCELCALSLNETEISTYIDFYRPVCCSKSLQLITSNWL